ncbi:MAG: hypothetical protein KF764_01840 [Labilithrix sp.]|nr:hypothetical protein [Labilithrix sp.]
MADAKDPENKTARDLLNQLQQLGTRAASDFLSLVHRVNEARDEADGTPLSGGDNSGISTKPRPSGGELLYDLVKLQLDAANKLLEMSHKHTDLVLDRVQRASAPFVDAQKRVTRLKAEAPADRPASWEVYVHNAAHRARRIQLRTSRMWTDRDGKEVAPCDVKISPSEIPARCERQVEITHEASDKLRADSEYTADVTLVLDRQDVGTIELTLKVS